MKRRAHGTTNDAREAAEIRRSSDEATRTSGVALLPPETELDRYFNPPATTPYPLEYAYSQLGDVRGKTVLDFGCGSGENCPILARRGAQVVAVDISESLISLAMKRLRTHRISSAVHFVVASAHDLPLADASIDVVFGIAILHHLDLASTSRELSRVLKAGGRAIFQEPVRDSRILRRLRALIPYHAADVSPFERPLTTRELHDFAKPFQITSMRAFSLPFVNIASAFPRLRRTIRQAYRLDRAILRTAPFMKAIAGIRVMQVVKP